MPKSITLTTPLSEHLSRLARFDPCPYPVVSLYLNLQPDEHGRDNYSTFLKKAFSEELERFEHGSLERESFKADVDRIEKYLRDELDPSANGLALFACSAEDDFFEAIQLVVPIDEHWLFISAQPHLYPLARLEDQYPRYAVVVLDTNAARLFVFALGSVDRELSVQNVKTRRVSEGGWSEARYQRHVENYHAQHIKEVAERLERLVREERVDRIILAGDHAVALPLLRDKLPKQLAEKVADSVSLDITTPAHEILDATLQALRRKDAATDREKVAEALGAWHARGLGVAGAEATLGALEMGQVDELLISASPGAVKRLGNSAPAPGDGGTASAGKQRRQPVAQPGPESVALSDTLVTKARQTGASITFIEDEQLLEPVGGVAALLRFRV